MERDGFCRSVRSKLNYFMRRDTKGQENKSCVRLLRIPDWHTFTTAATLLPCYIWEIGTTYCHRRVWHKVTMHQWQWTVFFRPEGTVSKIEC